MHTQDDYAPEQVLPDETPDEIESFIVENNVADKYRCLIKSYPEGGGLAGSLKSFTNEYPSIDEIGKTWGPGDYGYLFSWRAEGPSGKKESKGREYRIYLPEDAWRDVFEDSLFQKNKYRMERRQRDLEKIKQDSILDAAKSGVDPSKKDPISDLRQTAALLKDLGVSVGSSSPKSDFLPMLAGLLPIALEFIKSRSQDSERQQNLTIQLMQESQKKQMEFMQLMMLNNSSGKGESEHMRRIMDMTFGAIKQVSDFKMMLSPEKESVADKIFGLVDKALPQVLELAAMAKEKREENFIYKMAAQSPDMQAVKADPTIALDLVQRWDEHYGFETTNDILKVAGFERPSETLGNKDKYPSEKTNE